MLRAVQGGEAQLPVETLAPRWPRLVPWSPPPIHPVSLLAWEVPSALGCCVLPHGFLGQPEPLPTTVSCLWEEGADAAPLSELSQ